jgi:hypothetical protein
MSDASPRPLPGLPRRVLAVFVSPGQLFEQLRDKPVWGGAMLLLVVLNLVMMFLLPAELFEEQVRRSLEGAGNEMSDSAIETAVTVGRFAGIAMAGVMGAVGTFAIGAIMFFVFGTLLGDNGRYRHYLSVCAHALLISSVGGLVQVPLRRLQGDMEVTLSLGTFAPFLEEGFLLNFLNAIGLFGLWVAMLMALGVTRIQPGRSWGGAFTIILGLFCVFALGIAAISSMAS